MTMFVIFYSFLAFLFWLLVLVGYLFECFTLLFIILSSLLFLSLLRYGFSRIINTFSLKK